MLAFEIHFSRCSLETKTATPFGIDCLKRSDCWPRVSIYLILVCYSFRKSVSRGRYKQIVNYSKVEIRFQKSLLLFINKKSPTIVFKSQRSYYTRKRLEWIVGGLKWCYLLIFFLRCVAVNLFIGLYSSCLLCLYCAFSSIYRFVMDILLCPIIC